MEVDERRGLTPFAVTAQAGATNTGAVDPLDGARRALPRAQRLAARRRGLRRLRGARRPRPAARDRAGRLGHARPAQVALPAVRVRLRARPRRPGAARGVRDAARVPARRADRERRGQLLRPRPAADPLRAGAEALGLAALLRRRRLPRGDPPLARAGRRRRPPRRAERDAGADGAALARRRLLPPPRPRRRRATPGSSPPSSAAARASSPPRGCTAASRCASAC